MDIKTPKKIVKKLPISWNKPTKKFHGLNYETFCLGQYNGIAVCQNRYIRGDKKTGNNDIAYKIGGVSGWVNYGKFIDLLEKEDVKRAPRRKAMEDKGIEPMKNEPTPPTVKKY